MTDKPFYPSFWLDKPYYSFNAYCQKVFHEKLYKIAVNAGMTCPNRDGTLGYDGCIFCSAGGSGDFAVDTASLSITEQIQNGLSLFGSKKTGKRFIIYFQAYTNTYAPISRLRSLYTQALEDAHVAGISIATRPDCLPDDVLALLDELRASYPEKFIWIELGLQTIHEKSAAYIRRAYPLSRFTAAVDALHRISIPVIVHIILGLPGETKEQMYQTISFLNTLPIFGVKLQLLHVLKDTGLAEDYQNGSFSVLSMDSYVNLLIGCLERLSSQIVVHRITGDGPKELLLAPRWSLAKRTVLNTIHHELRLRRTWQGKELNHNDTGPADTL